MDALLSLWNVLAAMAPWLLVGFFLAGAVSVLLPREWVVKAMGRARGWRGVLNAVMIGVPLPICSCGVLPLTTGLRKAGAGKGAVAGFLISTPQTGIDSILATYALMGPIFAVARPLAAFATGIVGGMSVDVFMGPEAPLKSDEPHKCCCHHGHKEALPERPKDENVILRIMRTGFGELLGEIARPLFFGLIVSAIVTAYVPENFFASAFSGNDWLAMPAMVIIGFPMYVCSTASIPIAASLVAKGLTPGAAFVFLMVGPAINTASLATVAKLIGIRATILYGLVIAFGSIACGIGINLLPQELLNGLAAATEQEHVPWFGHTAAVVLLICIAHHLLRSRRHPTASATYR